MRDKYKLKILFVSHDASRTGAPIVLLHLLRWLKTNKNIELTILLKDAGELEAEFRNTAPTYSLINSFVPSHNMLIRGVKKIARKLSLQPQSKKYIIPKPLQNQTYDIIYLNTVVSLNLASLLKQHYNCPVVAHIHENDFTINYYYPNSLELENINAVDHFIAVSNSTKYNLIENYYIAADKISLVYECIDTERVRKPNLNKIREIKQELSLDNEFVVGGSGLTSWRKGVDLFVQLAVALNRLRPSNTIKLVWVGAISREFQFHFLYECERLQIKDKVIFSGSKPNPEDYFQLFSVFSLTSREDPFPLVVLEAAAQAKPIICFEKSGGIPELLSEGGGILVPYGNVQAMAEQVLYLYDHPEIKNAMGRDIEREVQKFDVNVVGVQILKVLNDVLSR